MGCDPIVLCASGFTRTGPQPPGEIVWCEWWKNFLRPRTLADPDFEQLTMADLKLYEFSKMLAERVPPRSYFWWDYPNLSTGAADPDRARRAFVTFAQLLRFAKEVRPDLRHLLWGYPLHLGPIGVAEGGLTGWGARNIKLRDEWPEAREVYKLMDVACIGAYVYHANIQVAADYAILAFQWAHDLGNLPIFAAAYDHRIFALPAIPGETGKLSPPELMSADDWRYYCQRIRSLMRPGDGFLDWGANGPYDPESEHKIIVKEVFGQS